MINPTTRLFRDRGRQYVAKVTPAGLLRIERRKKTGKGPWWIEILDPSDRLIKAAVRAMKARAK